MTIKKPFPLLPFLLIFASLSAYAQPRKQDTSLTRFLQTNFDSTIIYHSWSSWYIYSNYRIVAKKDSSIYFFIYKSPYNLPFGRIPGDLSLKFVNEQVLFQQTDTNRYFLPVFIDPAERKKAWTNINAYNIWQTAAEPKTPANCMVYDCGYDTFYLIVKDSMRVLNYYNAEYAETCGPPNLHRQHVIQTKKGFGELFK